jgi:hypothetical protein
VPRPAVSIPGDHILVALEGSEQKQKRVFGELLPVKSGFGKVSFDIFIPGADKPAGHVERRRDDMAEPLPEEVLALLKPGGLEKPAIHFYKGLKDGQKTPELDAKVTQLRVAGAKKVVATYDEPGGWWK